MRGNLLSEYRYACDGRLFWHLLAVLSLSGCLTLNSGADYSDRRQILVFATPGSESGEQIQRSVDALRCQLADRETDVRFVDITELPGAEAPSTDAKHDTQGLLAQMAMLRSQERPDFEVVLIGKDGGVKARANDPDVLEEFLALIDTMPMRRAELRSRVSDDSACEGEY